MKYQIRQGVFETNSSSTHSMQVVSGKSIDEIMGDINREIVEGYNGHEHSKTMYVDDFIKSDGKGNGTLVLRGFDMDDSDEASYVYYVMQSTLSKIQYMFMYLYKHLYYFDEFKENQIDKFTSIFFDMKNSKLYETFKDALFKYIYDKLDGKLGGMKILGIEMDYDEVFECPYIDDDDALFTTYKVSDIESEVYNILDEKHILIYRDKAYSPYNAPKIEII